MSDAVISRECKKQETVAFSSMQAGYMLITKAFKVAMDLRV